VIDDINLGITHVVRGEDHVSNSAVQIQMFEALGSSAPQFAHAALLVAAEGKMSKRLGSYGVTHLREEGVEPMALLSLLARIGTSQPVEPVPGLAELARDFDFAHFGRAPAHFDPHDVELINARLIHQMDYGEVKHRLPEGARQEDWELVRPNIERVGEFDGWMPVIHGEIDPPDLDQDERALVREAAAIAQDIDWSNEPWKQLATRLKEATGQKGRALFHPLRAAITGLESGPEMAGLAVAIGKDKVVARLKAAAKR
jgi:glutamyl-tRNA synthetase